MQSRLHHLRACLSSEAKTPREAVHRSLATIDPRRRWCSSFAVADVTGSRRDPRASRGGVGRSASATRAAEQFAKAGNHRGAGQFLKCAGEWGASRSVPTSPCQAHGASMLTFSFRRRRAHAGVGLAALALTVTLTRAPAAHAQAPDSEESSPARCGVGVARTGRGFLPLPRGDVFCPLLADPKAIRSFVTYQRGDVADFAADIAAVGIGAVRLFGSPVRARDGVQLGLAGAVFAQSPRCGVYDLLNADTSHLRSPPPGRFSGRRGYPPELATCDEFCCAPRPRAGEPLVRGRGANAVARNGALRSRGRRVFSPRSGQCGHLLHAGASSGRVGRRPGHRGARARGRRRREGSEDSPGAGRERARGFEFDIPRVGAGGTTWSIPRVLEGPSPYGQFHRSDSGSSGSGSLHDLSVGCSAPADCCSLQKSGPADTRPVANTCAPLRPSALAGTRCIRPASRSRLLERAAGYTATPMLAGSASEVQPAPR